MLRRKRTEVHVNQERWLVSYADFITLLFAFFVVMYSISQVNQSKYRVLSETFEHAFPATTPTHLLPPEHTQTAAPDSRLNPIQVGQPVVAPTPSAINVRGNNTEQAATETQDMFSEISALVSTRFDDLLRDELISIDNNELWLKIEMKDSILFPSGSADASLQAQVIFEEIAQILKDYPNPVQVEGYTDNVPINTAKYPSNWELSSARASAIVKWLARKGVEPARLSAVGFGEYQPIASNDTPDGRAQNRRIALMIARKPLPRPGIAMDTDKVSEAISAQSEARSSAANSADTPVPGNVPVQPSLSGQTASAATSVSSSVSSAAVPINQADENLVPVELEDGGLLFTSDPDLPRNLP